MTRQLASCCLLYKQSSFEAGRLQRYDLPPEANQIEDAAVRGCLALLSQGRIKWPSHVFSKIHQLEHVLRTQTVGSSCERFIPQYHVARVEI